MIRQTLKKLTSFTTALVLMLSALTVWTPGKALAATRTWDGGGDGASWSDESNWDPGQVPANGDTVVFDMSVLTENTTIENDIEGLSLAGITRTGTSQYSLTIEGNPIILTVPITGGDVGETGILWLKTDIVLGANMTLENMSLVVFDDNAFGLGSYNLTVTDANLALHNISGSGNITVNGFGTLQLAGTAANYTGDITVTSGNLEITSAGAVGPNGSITTSGSSTLTLGFSGDFLTPLTLGNSGPYAQLLISNAYENTTAQPVVIKGGLTLTTNVEVWVSEQGLKIANPYNPGNYKLTLAENTQGSLTYPDGTKVEPETKTVTIGADDKKPNESVGVSKNKTYIIDGERGSVFVSNGGTLKGTGKIGALYAYTGAKVAPGHSPGTLTVLNSLNLAEGSEFEAEVLNKDSYDQFIVGESFSGSTAVTLDNATLSLWIPDGFSISQNDTFTIIDNKHSSAVSGTFKDLPEGATFKAGGKSNGVFKISYVGGDGNDVVLSVVTVPTVPSTGFFLNMSNPAFVLVAALAAAGAAFYLTRRLAFAAAKR